MLENINGYLFGVQAVNLSLSGKVPSPQNQPTTNDDSEEIGTVIAAAEKRR